jgi:tRNA(Ile)-lysidine synthase
MSLEFEKKVADFIEASELLGSGDKVLLAVSGGADSMALLYAMQSLKAKNVSNVALACAHVNHQLRTVDADLDEEFVIAQATKLKLAVTTKRIDVRGFARRDKLSVETAARQLRIKALIDIARSNNCSRIATAHHKNDNAETLLQRLIRGTGFRGLGGIWPTRVFDGGIRFVRPLLCVTRDEIIDYLQERELKWRQDHTNADCTYRRNYIRHRLLPALQRDCTDSVVEQLSELARSARRSYSSVCSSADKLWPSVAQCAAEKTALDLKIFLTQPEPVRVELIRRSLANVGCGERDFTQRHYKSILGLAGQNATGRSMELPGGFVVWREYGKLIFAPSTNRRAGFSPPNSCRDRQADESATLEVPGRTRFGRYLIEAAIFEVDNTGFKEFITSKTNCVEWFDLEQVKLPLIVRFRQAGDKFVPLGLGSEKRLGKFLTAQQVPHEMRRKAIVVADIEKIIWLWPVRMSEQTKVTAQTRSILQLQITDSDSK